MSCGHGTPLRQRPSQSNASPNRRYERYFFTGMSVLILGTVFLGFAKTYFLAGVFRAPLPSWVIHIHGAAFTSWVLFLIVQTSLVSAGRRCAPAPGHGGVRLGVCDGGLGCDGGDRFVAEGTVPVLGLMRKRSTREPSGICSFLER